MADGRIWPEPTPDRRRLGTVGVVAVAALLAVSFWAALSTLTRTGSGEIFLQAAVLTAALAVLGLRSIPVRWIARSYALVGGLLILRVGALGAEPGVSAATPVVVWILSAGAALALSPTPSRRSQPAEATPADAERGPGGPGGSGGGGGQAWSARLRGVGAVVALVCAAALLIGPLAADLAAPSPSSGSPSGQFDRGPDNALTVQDQLDMTRRPRLTDNVVMTVRSDIVSFWRTATYDRWNGSQWTNTDGGAYRSITSDGTIFPTSDDVAATIGVESTQQFRLEGGFANALPVAPSAVEVTGPSPLIQRPDGSLVAPRGLGAGATYATTSRQVPVDVATMRAATGPVPSGIADRYAKPASTTDRVRALAREITAGVTTDVDKVHAIDAWMGSHLTYSIDAPLAPQGVDVVDDFLFESKQGWCEQIASSLVVMLREVGVPARLATGFAPGEWDAATGRYVVRERDAHAWTEVWFPGVGWVPFDPTASVPFAGDQASKSHELSFTFAAVAIILVALAVAFVLAGPLANALGRLRRRLSERRSRRRVGRSRWDVAAERELEELGRTFGRPRGPGDTVPAHARRVAEATGVRDLARAGDVIDRVRYRDPSDEAERPFVEDALAAARGASRGPIGLTVEGDGDPSARPGTRR